MKNKPMKSNGLKMKSTDSIDRYSNYRQYVLFPNAKKVDEEKLRKVIEMLRDFNGGDGYIRFMAVSNSTADEPMCTVYEGREKSSVRLGGLVALSELEEYLKIRAAR